MKLIFKLLIVIIIGITIYGFNNSKKEKFIGESKLVDCRIKIPLSYSTKGQKDLKIAAEKYKDTEIVLVTKLKKGQASYNYYYIVAYEGTYGPSAFLQKSDIYKSDAPNKSALFMNYKPKKHSFYLADCFRKKLKEDSSLKESLKTEN